MGSPTTIEGIEFDKPVITHAEYGHSGPGCYVHEEDYPEEGSVLLADVVDVPVPPTKET